MVSTTNSRSAAAAESTGTNNNLYNQPIDRRPFIQVAQEWTVAIDQKVQSKVIQNKTTSDLPKLAAIEDERSFEELLVIMNEQETVNARFLFACRNGSDSVSLQLLNHLVETCSSDNSLFSKSSVSKITDQDNANCTLMHVCAQRNKPQCMEFLMSFKMSVDVLDSLSSTPLHFAVAQNCHDSVLFLLNKGANINAKDSYSKFPLLIALKHKHYALAELLASFRPDVHLRVSKGNTALHIMAEEGDITAVRLLVETLNASPMRKNNEEENVLYNALPHFEIVQYLAIQFASKGLDRLLGNTNTSGKSILHKCGADGHIDNFLLLLKYMNLRDFNQKQIESLLNTMDKRGDTPLLLAVKNSRKELVRFLVECAEVELNEGDSTGTTALQTAVNISDKDMINTLSQAGASLKPNKHDEEEESNNCSTCFTSMTTTLVLILSVISIICVVSMTAISLGFYGESIKGETKAQRNASFREVSDHLKSELSRHTVSTIAGLSAFQDNLLDTSTSLQNAYVFSFNYIRSMLNISDLMVDVWFGTPEGDQAGVFAFPNSPIDVYTMNATQMLWVHHFAPSLWNQSMEQIITTGEIEYANATEFDKFGDFYQTANNSLGPAWSLSYAQLSLPGALYISFMNTVRDPITKEMLLYMGSDISTEAISLFLTERSVDGSTIVIIEKSTGYLISTSDPNFLVYSNNGIDIERFDGSTGNNGLIKKMLSYVRGRFGYKLEKVESTAYGLFKFEQRAYLLTIGELKDDYGLDWLIVQAVPRALFFKSFKIAIGSMIGLTCVLLIFGVIVSIGASVLFMAPLKRLSSLAETIKLLQLEEVERKLAQDISFFSEIRSLQSSFGSMSLRLKQFRQFIPEHILAVIETEVAHKEILKQETLSATVNKGSSKGPSIEKKGEVELNTMSETCSDTRVSTVHANYHSKGLVKNALTSGLVSGTVSVMTIKFDDLAQILESYSSADVNETMKDLLTAIKDKVRESNAQLVYHSHSHAVIAWNTLISQSDHRARALRTAVGCQKAILSLQEVWRMKGLPLLDIQIGLSSGASFYGNIGSELTKIFTVIGRAATESNTACHLNDAWGTRILVSHDIYQAGKDSYFLRPIDRVTDELCIYELGEARNTDEWVQELSQGVSKENDVWFEYTRGFKSFDRRDYEQAFVTFSEYLTKHPYDVVAQKMVDKSRAMSEF